MNFFNRRVSVLVVEEPELISVGDDTVLLLAFTVMTNIIVV